MVVEARGEVRIDADVETVFSFMDEPANQAAVTPRLRVAERIERRPNGGNRARYEYRLLGVTFEGEVVATTYRPPETIVYDMRGDLSGTITFDLERAGGGTRLTYAAAYDLPAPVPDRVVAPIVRWLNRRDIETLLRNVKRRLEDERAPGE